MDKFKIKHFYVFAGIIIYMCVGSVYSWSVFRKPLEQILNISTTQSGNPYMLFLLFFALFMPLGGKLIEKIGPFLTIFLGTILLSSGFIISGITKNIIHISISYGLISGTGVGLIYGVPISVIGKWFPERRGFFMGFTLAGFGLSPFVTAPLSRFFIQKYGPFQTFIILGIMFFILINALSISLKFPNKEEKIFQDKEEDKKNIFKTKEFYGLWLCYFIGTFAGLMAIGITSPFAQEVVKISSSSAALYVSILSIFNALGRPLFGFLSDKIKVHNVVSILFLLVIIGSLNGLFIKEHNTLKFLFTFSLLWLILGGWLATAPSITSRYFGLKNYSTNYGFVFTAYGFGAVAGTYLAGKLRDLFGTYLNVFYPLIILSVIGIILNLTILRKNK